MNMSKPPTLTLPQQQQHQQQPLNSMAHGISIHIDQDQRQQQPIHLLEQRQRQEIETKLVLHTKHQEQQPPTQQAQSRKIVIYQPPNVTAPTIATPTIESSSLFKATPIIITSRETTAKPKTTIVNAIGTTTTTIMRTAVATPSTSTSSSNSTRTLVDINRNIDIVAAAKNVANVHVIDGSGNQRQQTTKETGCNAVTAPAAAATTTTTTITPIAIAASDFPHLLLKVVNNNAPPLSTITTSTTTTNSYNYNNNNNNNSSSNTIIVTSEKGKLIGNAGSAQYITTTPTTTTATAKSNGIRKVNDNHDHDGVAVTSVIKCNTTDSGIRNTHLADDHANQHDIHNNGVNDDDNKARNDDGHSEPNKSGAPNEQHDERKLEMRRESLNFTQLPTSHSSTITPTTPTTQTTATTLSALNDERNQSNVKAYEDDDEAENEITKVKESHNIKHQRRDGSGSGCGDGAGGCNVVVVGHGNNNSNNNNNKSNSNSDFVDVRECYGDVVVGRASQCGVSTTTTSITTKTTTSSSSSPPTRVELLNNNSKSGNELNFAERLENTNVDCSSSNSSSSTNTITTQRTDTTLAKHLMLDCASALTANINVAVAVDTQEHQNNYNNNTSNGNQQCQQLNSSVGVGVGHSIGVSGSGDSDSANVSDSVNGANVDPPISPHVVKIRIIDDKEHQSKQLLQQQHQVTVVQVNNEQNKKFGENDKIKNCNSKNNQLYDKMVIMQKLNGNNDANQSNGNGVDVSVVGGNTSVTELNVQAAHQQHPTTASYLYYNTMMSSGQFSPCDTLDSGTGSDLESGGGGGNGVGQSQQPSTPKQTHMELHLKTTKIRLNANGCTNNNSNNNNSNSNGTTTNSNNNNNNKSKSKDSGGGIEHNSGEHQRAGSLTDSEESESSSLSCDSLHSTTEYVRQTSLSPSGGVAIGAGGRKGSSASPACVHASKVLSRFLPDSLLRDIRDRKFPQNDFTIKYGNDNNDDDNNDNDASTVTIGQHNRIDCDDVRIGVGVGVGVGTGDDNDTLSAIIDYHTDDDTMDDIDKELDVLHITAKTTTTTATTKTKTTLCTPTTNTPHKTPMRKNSEIGIGIVDGSVNGVGLSNGRVGGGSGAVPPNKTFVLNALDGSFIDTKMNSMPNKYEADKYYKFHVNEHENFRSFGENGNNGELNGDSNSADVSVNGIYNINNSMNHSNGNCAAHDDDAFAGYRDIHCGSNSATSTIRSSKGTVRGVKNRVRNGIATFLQLQQPHVKNYMEKDLGKVVLYTTSMGIIRDTYAKCSNVKQILRTLLVKFEERDVFMSVEYQQEIKDRMHSEIIKVPQLFVEGQHIGDADTVERLNESGELRQLLKPYKSIASTYTCQTCGGYRLLPCPSCNGSKKSVHRNHFTAEFVALKCMNCDEVGLVKCHKC